MIEEWLQEHKVTLSDLQKLFPTVKSEIQIFENFFLQKSKSSIRKNFVPYSNQDIIESVLILNSHSFNSFLGLFFYSFLFESFKELLDDPYTDLKNFADSALSKQDSSDGEKVLFL